MKKISLILVLALIIMIFGVYTPKVTAATNVITALSDTMTRQKTTTNSGHTIKFTVSQAVNTIGDTIVITFPSDFNFSTKAIPTAFTHGASTGLEQAEVIQAGVSATDFKGAFSGTQNRIFTLTVPSDGIGLLTIAAGNVIIITFDSTNAINGTTVTTYLVTVATTGSNAGSSTLAITLLAEDTVTITGTVNPTLTWTLGTPAVTFTNPLSSASNNMYSSGTLLTAATNADTGYDIQYMPSATLTSGANTITAIGTTLAAASAGSSQFGMNLKLNTGSVGADPTGSGIGAPTTNYNTANSFAFNTSGNIIIASSAGETLSNAYTLSFLANITTTTLPGVYTTSIVFICTGRF